MQDARLTLTHLPSFFFFYSIPWEDFAVAIEAFKPGMQALRARPSADQQDQKLHEVSELYEKQFMREMMKAMRGTVQESGLLKVNQAEKIFREQLDGEYVEKWSAKGGIGLANLIYNQLIEKYGTQLGIRGPIAKPHGPLALDHKSNFQGQLVSPSGAGSNKLTYRFDRDFGSSSVGETTTLTAPWAGKLVNAQDLSLDEHLLDFEHDNGLKSRVVFRGLRTTGQESSQIQAGEPIGLLGPEVKSFFWTLEHSKETVSE